MTTVGRNPDKICVQDDKLLFPTPADWTMRRDWE